MFQSLRKMFRPVTPLVMATQELVAAERSKLEAQTGQEYAAALCTYHDARIKRLRAYIKEAVQEDIKKEKKANDTVN